jgi:pyrroloquinoline quinone biosynthesis protein D
VNPEPPLRFANGIRLRKEGDKAYLMIPEGLLELSSSALAILELIDGKRNVDELVYELEREFDAPAGEVRADVVQLCATLYERGILRT